MNKYRSAAGRQTASAFSLIRLNIYTPNGRRNYIALYIMYIAYTILHFAPTKLLHFVCVLVKMSVSAMSASDTGIIAFIKTGRKNI